jgi:glutamate decarboxylase
VYFTTFLPVYLRLTILKLISAISGLIKPFIKSADDTLVSRASGKIQPSDSSGSRIALVEAHPPEELKKLLDLKLPQTGGGKDGVLEVVSTILNYSVNTWDEGFMDKLYASTNAVCRDQVIHKSG